ncbi:FKBP-type peptidyl-prolyl cis-trans isomerase [Cellulomonas sp. HZM]|uniref:FKBP-type peptidyl-prolyl cis-trans isomerase n=1 Tax=Cellulomonas sp. HZM TaxID=1454010 RepID=UPI0004936508|nr:FKBP-type peptidyl-prolyl cis-trans isomerase [Cellulomonas sp. HZM]
MRRTNIVRSVAAGALTLTLAFSLTACGSDDDASSKPTASSTASADPTASATAAPTASAADIALVKQIKLEGEAGKEPKITLPKKPFEMSGIVGNLVKDGSGKEIKDGDTLITQLVAVNAADGSVSQSTYTSNPEAFTAGSTGIPDLDTALKGAHVGARAVLAANTTGSTQVFAIEVVDSRTIPDRAEGTAVAPKDGLPVITLDSSGKPTMAPSKADKPTTLVTQPLIEGKGAEVKKGQVVTVKYAGWLWDGTEFDASWDRTPSVFPIANIGAAQVIDGWNEGLVGQKVGSQVLLVIPPDKGYGDNAQGSIPAKSTLVFVVDILDAA